jgi:hypothetical protein
MVQRVGFRALRRVGIAKLSRVSVDELVSRDTSTYPPARYPAAGVMDEGVGLTPRSKMAVPFCHYN